MTKRLLIDATHPEETRVAVVDNHHLVELDFEAASKRPVKGNIYLAKVTRVEPSLQAAFLEYGNNRQGFLPFSEIHPDYFRIPIADREALKAEEAVAEDAPLEASTDELDENGETGEPETLANANDEEIRRPRRNPKRIYKIQEVIKKRQIMLVQVTKEERGNKGAALTTYLSLAGRYCVLMPNSHRGGGVSRKITDGGERKRMKEIMDELQLPEGIGVILRTAGMDRTKTEIKRDYEFLLRQWEDIRALTLQSTAPALIYEEGDLIRRSLRDIYQRDTDEIWVEGEEGHKAAKAFMKMLMPSHAKKVQLYKDPLIPLFHRFHVEQQIDAIFKPVCPLPSGGYLVINQTEALVSIDVNSGKAIRERHIEETALRTNLEAADEVARQLRLRDLAGLIVVDFIDMDDRRNNHSVERRLKDALKSDRARIQVGRISGFGLLEMSRQRLRPSIAEINSEVCQHCAGSGRVPSIEAAALYLLRAIEETGLQNRTAELKVCMPGHLALYLFNHKRHALTEIEQRYHLKITVAEDNTLMPPYFRLETIAERTPEEQAALHTESHAAWLASLAENAEAEKNRGRRGRRRGGREREDLLSPVRADEEDEDEILGENGVQFADPEDGEASEREDENTAEGDDEGRPSRRRRRRRRRGRGNRDSGVIETTALDEAVETVFDADAPVIEIEAVMGGDEPDSGVVESEVGQGAKPPRRRRTRTRRGQDDAATAGEGTGDAPAMGAAEPSPIPVATAPKPTPPAPQPVATPVVAAVATAPAAPAVPALPRRITTAPENVAVIPDDAPTGGTKRGWWSRFVNN